MTKESDFNSVITQQLTHLDKFVQTQEEFNDILKELLGIIKIKEISHCGLKCFDSWLLNKTGDEMAVTGFLQILGTTVEDCEALGFLLESTLMCYFHNNGISTNFLKMFILNILCSFRF